MCRKGSDCFEETECNGLSAMCPKSRYYEDGTLCHQGVRVCQQGSCYNSQCVQSGLQDCFCQVESTSEFDVEKNSITLSFISI